MTMPTTMTITMLSLPYLMALTIVLACLVSSTLEFNSDKAAVNYAAVAESGNYSCDEITRWLGAEKHYSNDKKKILFELVGKDRDCTSLPSLQFKSIMYGWSFSSSAMAGTGSSGGGGGGGHGNRLTRSYYDLTTQTTQAAVQRRREDQQCSVDEFAVAFLSNFSINNNFSHFLHALLRLFCALIDARWIVWDAKTESFIQAKKYVIWLDEYFKVSDAKMKWIRALGPDVRHLKEINRGQCIVGTNLLYGSGCVKLLPPEKWFGYPGCRAAEILPSFGHYMRKKFMGTQSKDMVVVDEDADEFHGGLRLRVSFAVRDVGAETGRREISNLREIQAELVKNQHIRTSTENITFEHLDVSSTVRYMSGVHVFISVHGAGMTNMFFMNPGSAVVEIIPFPLCDCKSPDYFYGIGGYYHGSAVAQGIKHYPYCVPAEHVKWEKVPDNLQVGGKCSWRHLHAVDSVKLDVTRFASLMRKVERDLIASGSIILTKPIINMNPHANGRV